MGELNSSVANVVFYRKSNDTDEWKSLGNAKSIETTYPEDSETADEPMILGFDPGKTASISCELRVQINRKAHHLSKHGKNKRIRKKNFKKYMKILISELCKML